jgi:hypothetical protein
MRDGEKPKGFERRDQRAERAMCAVMEANRWRLIGTIQAARDGAVEPGPRK